MCFLEKKTGVSVKRINKFMNSDELDPDSVQHDDKESEFIAKKHAATYHCS